MKTPPAPAPAPLFRVVRGRKRSPPPPVRLGWVFAGGGARGAYEVGVCSYIFDRVAHEIGRPLPIDVVSGTSVGALHAAALAAWADNPQVAMRELVARWHSLSLNDVIRLDKHRAFNMIRALFGRPSRHLTPDSVRGGILDPRPLEKLLASAVEFRRIDDHIAAGRLGAVSLSTTHMASGATTIFYQSGKATLRPHARTRVKRVKLTAAHAMASAAIPFLFPAVRVDGELYCDGSLRQHVPLSPARHLGAEALVVINPRSAPGDFTRPGAGDEERVFPGPLFLLGKTLNALTLDRIDGDIEQLERMNRLLAAGTKRFGGRFVAQLNQTLAQDGGLPVKPLSLLHIHASEDLGRLAAAFVRSRPFRAQHRGALHRTFARLAEGEARTEADLLSYLLFDNRFTRDVVALGWRDAERRHDEIVGFFSALMNGDERQREKAPRSTAVSR